MIHDNRTISKLRRLLLASTLATLAATPALLAVPPIQPIPVPDYSFDLLSCAVDGGELDAGDVLNLAFPDPEVELSAAMLDVFYADDDLDALSGPNCDLGDAQTFTLLFSVDFYTDGVAAPSYELIRSHVPYNVYDQAWRGHAAGDQFMSTRLFSRAGAIAGGESNNVLTRNNYDEGGVDFSASPETSAYDLLYDGVFDVVDATGILPRVEGEIVNAYFSLSMESPSLQEMPTYDTPSGADIYVNESPTMFSPTTLYASYADLSLDEDDDIDALIVFDVNVNRLFDDDDQVLFSLTHESPSLATIPGASTSGQAGDIFSVRPGNAPVLFAAAADLGLGAWADNVNALELFVTTDPMAAAALHGIRSPLGDVDHDGRVNLMDLASLLSHYGATAGVDYAQGDLDLDGDVDLSDLAALLANYGVVCD